MDNKEDLFLIEGPQPQSDESYKYVEMNDDLKYIEKGIDVKEFNGNMGKRNLKIEFEILRKLTESPIHAKLLMEYNPGLAKLNRYSTIIPFKHTQVVLPSESTDDTDSYINANYITSSKEGENKSFIATQGPLETTKGHFWRMVWAEKVGVIIMLCQSKENNKSQCDVYWGDKSGKEFELENFKISVIRTEDISETFKKRTIQVENLKDSEVRTIEHYNWLGWPDHSVPDEKEYENISKLLNVMHEERKSRACPIVVHCSAGIGRTGTLISIYNIDLMFRELVKKSELVKISIFGMVRRLREQRWGMVNTKDQYQFIYKYTAELIEKYFGPQPK